MAEQNSDFLLFALKWVKDDLKDKMLERDLLDLVKLLDKQNHSGASWGAMMDALSQLISDYEKDCDREAEELLHFFNRRENK